MAAGLFPCGFGKRYCPTWIELPAKATIPELLKGGLCNSKSTSLENVHLVTVLINAEPAMVKVLYTQEVRLGISNAVLNVVVPAFAKLAMFPKEVAGMEADRQA